MTTRVKRSAEEIGSSKVILRCGTCRKAIAEARVKDATVVIKSTLSLFEAGNFVVLPDGARLFRCSAKACGNAGVLADSDLEALILAAAEQRRSVLLPLRASAS